MLIVIDQNDSDEEPKSTKRPSKAKFGSRKRPHLQLEYEREDDQEKDMETV